MLIRELLKSITVVTFSFVLIGTINAKSTDKPMLSNKVIATILPPGGRIVAGTAKDEFFILNKNEDQHKTVASTNHKTQHMAQKNGKHLALKHNAQKKIALSKVHHKTYS